MLIILLIYDSECEVYEHCYIEGNTIANDSRTNIEECNSACEENNSCAAWSFYLDEKRCLLKSKPNPLICATGIPWISATKGCLDSDLMPYKTGEKDETVRRKMISL